MNTETQAQMLLLRIQSQSAARTKRRIHHKQDFSQFSQFCQQTHIVFRFDCAVSTPRSRSLCFLSTKSMRPAFSRPFISAFFIKNWPLRMPLISLTFLDRNSCNLCVLTIVFRGFFSGKTRVSLDIVASESGNGFFFLKISRYFVFSVVKVFYQRQFWELKGNPGRFWTLGE